MRITTKATGTSVTPAIQQYVEKKIGHLEKFVDSEQQDSSHADVTIEFAAHSHQGGQAQFSAEVNFHSGAIHLHAKAENVDLYSAIDALKDEITRELVSKKGKRLHMLRRGGQKVKELLRGWTRRGE